MATASHKLPSPVSANLSGQKLARSGWSVEVTSKVREQEPRVLPTCLCGRCFFFITNFRQLPRPQVGRRVEINSVRWLQWIDWARSSFMLVVISSTTLAYRRHYSFCHIQHLCELHVGWDPREHSFRPVFSSLPPRELRVGSFHSSSFSNLFLMCTSLACF